LVAEVRVEQRLGHADLRRHLVHGHLGIAALGELRTCAVEHLPLPLGAGQAGSHPAAGSCAWATSFASPSAFSGTPKASTSSRACGRSSAQSVLTALITAFERAPESRPCSW